MDSEKQIALTTIVSAIIGKVSSYEEGRPDNISGTDYMRTFGTDIFFEETGEVILSDQKEKSTEITLEKLVLYVSKCLDKVS